MKKSELDNLLEQLHSGTTEVMLKEVRAYLEGEVDVSPQMLGKIIDWMKFNNFEVNPETDESMAELSLDFSKFEQTMSHQ